MPANKNALIRYKTIDNCLRRRQKKWTLSDLVEACSEALYEAEGIEKGISIRTVQGDIQFMRSEKLGYSAPIEVYDNKYYRYTDPNYSIMNMPLTQNDIEVLKESVDMLRHLLDFEQFSEMADVVSRLQDRLAITRSNRKPVVHYDRVTNLKGLGLLNPLYDYITDKQTLRIIYKSFLSNDADEICICPYLLKEYRNRWFLLGSRPSDLLLYNLPLDRIISLEPVSTAYRENPDFDVKHYYDNVIGVSKKLTSKATLIEFWANEKQSMYIKTKPLHHSQRLVSENPIDHSCIFSMEVVINFEMYSTFMSLGPGVRILSPGNVVKSMCRKLHEAVAIYNAKMEL